ncbi:putative ABC transport system permease protein [Promicromonospora umidemergens]|uniref:FtsX-like permease family protein n=1 Tax=Promicromonospora umidemergens TaxID=629679 RepID=A0ABP8WEA8_9MICO|nr:FtsX-like permease family protein [Promicromonospora umidemergens]MCP2284444.1 putative ABC transport system permease protein [Promicromonospora umidemergens]
MATSFPAARLTLAQMRRSAGRLASAGVAIAIGTAFVAATLLAGNVITSTTYGQVAAALADADLAVLDDNLSLTEADLDAARGVEGVAAADAQETSYTELNHGGKSVYQQIIAVASDERLMPLELSDGAWPAAKDEVALPPDVADRLGVEIGDVVTSSRWVIDDEPTTFDDGSEGYDGHDVAEKLTLTGLVDDPYAAYAGTGGAAVMSQAALAQRVTDGLEPGTERTVGAILVALDPAADPAAVDEALAAAVPAATDVTTSEAYAEKQVAQMSGGDTIFLVFVMAFAAVALVVAGLVIANTFQVLVAQRARTLALLRCVGATTGQLYRSVLLEAAVLGTLASLTGIVIGAALVQGGLMIAPTFDLGMPLPEAINLTTPVFVAPLAVGIVVTLAAALAPALAAARVAPLAALRPSDAPNLRKGAGRLRAVLATLMTLGGLALLGVGVALALEGELEIGLMATVGGGSMSLIGVIVGSVFWLPKVTAGIGRLVGTAGPSARLAAANTLRNPRRTAATSTALLIGVTLVGTMTTGAATARVAMDDELNAMYPVDVQISTAISDGEQEAAMAPAVTDAISGVAGLRGTAEVTSLYVETSDSRWPEIQTTVASPDDLRAVVNNPERFDRLQQGTLVVPEQLAKHHELEGLDEIELTGPGGKTTLDIATIDMQYGSAFMVPQDFQAIYPDLRANMIWAGVADGEDAADTFAAVQDAVSTTDEAVEVAGAVVDRNSFQQLIDVILGIVVGLLAVAVVIALIGVANTLSLSVIERNRESAMLRAIGLSKGQLRATLAIEGMLIAGVGAVLGVVLGLLYGWAGSATALAGIGQVTLVVPWAEIALILGVALLAGLVASVVPARAAVRTHPVAALAAE